jgi:hypothetical protein
MVRAFDAKPLKRLRLSTTSHIPPQGTRAEGIFIKIGTELFRCNYCIFASAGLDQTRFLP